MTAFSNALRSEWTKMASLRSTWIFAVLLVGSVVGPVVLIGLFMGESSNADWSRLLIGSGIFSLIAVAYAGSTVAGEYNNHLHAQAYLSQNNRHLWICARQVLNLVFLLVIAAIGAALACVSTFVLPDLNYTNEGFAAFGSFALNIVVFGLIAMAIAALTRSRVAAVAIPLAWWMVIEGLLTLAAGASKVALSFWLAAPGVRIQQLGGASADFMTTGMPTPPTGWEAGMTQPTWFNVLVLVAWAVVSIVAAIWVNAKRDVK